MRSKLGSSTLLSDVQFISDSTIRETPIAHVPYNNRLMINPFESPSAEATPVEPRSRLALINLTVRTYPLWVVVSLYATWFAGWAALGHVPRPTLDDPKHIQDSVHLTCYGTTFQLIRLTPVALLLGIIAELAIGPRQYVGRRRRAFVLVWAVSIGFLALDPVQAFNWFLD